MTKETDSTEIFKARLRAARDLRNLSQTELAEKAKMPQSSIAHFEAGARKPSFDTLKRLAGVLEVTTDYLLGLAEAPDVAKAGDAAFRDFGKLSTHDRDLAKEFLKMLADRSEKK